MDEVKFSLITTVEDLQMVVKYMSKIKFLGLDTETTSLEPVDGKLRLIQLSDGKKTAVIDCFKFTVTQLVDALKDLLESKEIVKICHNGKFEAKWLWAKLGIELGLLFDTFLAAKLIDYNPPHGLGPVAQKYIGKVLDKSEQVSDWSGNLTDAQLEYAASDAHWMPLLRSVLLEDLERTKQIKAAKIEFEEVVPLAMTELRGLKVNRETYSSRVTTMYELRDLSANSLQELLRSTSNVQAVQESLFDMPEINYADVMITSPDKIRKAFAKLGVPILTKGQGEEAKKYYGSFKYLVENKNDPKLIKKLNKAYPQLRNFYEGQKEKYKNSDGTDETFIDCLERVSKNFATSTGAKALKPLQNDYPVLKKLADFRGTEKLVTSYGLSFLLWLKKVGLYQERVFPEYHQIGAPTGRMACKNPNVQQVPSKAVKVGGKEYYLALREAMDFPEGYIGISADYSQIELRILADFTNDQPFVEVFLYDKDLHADTASRVFNVPYEDCKNEKHPFYKKYRAPAKNMNFGIVYGISGIGLSAMIDQSVEEAEEMIKRYAKAYPEVWIWLENQAKMAQTTLQARTMSGRLQVFTPPSKNQWGKPNNSELNLIGRNGRNMPVQGTGADIFKRAHRLLYDGLKKYDAHIVALVHDEFMIEVREDQAEEVRPLVEKYMKLAGEEFIKRVPVKVDAKIVRNWSEKS